jgi:hypothetical protein
MLPEEAYCENSYACCTCYDEENLKKIKLKSKPAQVNPTLLLPGTLAGRHDRKYDDTKKNIDQGVLAVRLKRKEEK